MELREKIARQICADAGSGFCECIGGDLGCKVGRGVSGGEHCIATPDQLMLSGYLPTADRILGIVLAEKVC